MCVLPFEGSIEAIYSSRNTLEYGFIALLSNMRFAIYDVYDNSAGGTEYSLLWDKDYRFDRQLKDHGKILCLDFE